MRRRDPISKSIQEPGTYWKAEWGTTPGKMLRCTCPKCWYQWFTSPVGLMGVAGGLPEHIKCPRCEVTSQYVSCTTDDYEEKRAAQQRSRI